MVNDNEIVVGVLVYCFNYFYGEMYVSGIIVVLLVVVLVGVCGEKFVN